LTPAVRFKPKTGVNSILEHDSKTALCQSSTSFADPGSFTVHGSRSSADSQLEGKLTLTQAIVLPVKK